MSDKEVSRGKFNFDAPIVNGRPAPYRHIGKYRVRADARDIVTGRCTFLDDYSVPRMIYAQVLRSPYPHALITKIDVEKARSFPASTRSSPIRICLRDGAWAGRFIKT